MMGHKLCFCGEIWLTVTKVSQVPLFIWSTLFIAIKSVARSVNIQCNTLKCLSIGTPKTINFPFVSNGK